MSLDSREKIEAAFSGIFDRLERQTSEVRGLVLWALTSRWCLACGETYDVCEAAGECGDNVCCCGTPRRQVTAEQCPKCEMVHMRTVKVAPEAAPEERSE